jgi:hypothetical protein
MGFDQTSNVSAVRWGFDPFLDECDRNVTLTHGLGGPCYGWEKTGRYTRGQSLSIITLWIVDRRFRLTRSQRRGN